MERSAPVEPILLDQARQLEELRRPSCRLVTPTEAILLMIMRLVGAFMGCLSPMVGNLGLGVLDIDWATQEGARAALSHSGSSGGFS